MHSPWLDWIRFLAALVVLLAHARGATFVEYGALLQSDKGALVAIWYALTRVEEEAVIVFFVLSGYLVGGMSLERMLARQFSPANYAIDRISRIMLPLFPALVLTAIIGFVVDLPNLSIEVFIGNLLSLQGVLVSSYGKNAPLWSLAYEAWFYILVWAIGLFTLKHSYQWLAGLTVLLVGIVFIALSAHYLFCWLFGMFAYFTGTDSRKIKLQIIVSIILIMYGVLSVQIVQSSDSFDFSGISSFFPEKEVAHLILAAGIAIFIRAIVNFEPRRIFVKNIEKVGTTFASFSYTLYLTHYPLLYLFGYLGLKRADSVTLGSLGIYILVCLFCVLVAFFMYLLFERRTRAVRQWMKRTAGVSREFN